MTAVAGCAGARAALIGKYSDSRSRFVALPDGSVAHVRVEGAIDKPTVVLLHGAMNSLQSFEPWANVLTQNYRAGP
jgi:pimeloyl-ACP methyl ester carboxylesterase